MFISNLRNAWGIASLKFFRAQGRKFVTTIAKDGVVVSMISITLCHPGQHTIPSTLKRSLTALNRSMSNRTTEIATITARGVRPRPAASD